VHRITAGNISLKQYHGQHGMELLRMYLITTVNEQTGPSHENAEPFFMLCARLSGNVLDLRARGLGFDSRHTGHIEIPWARFESTLSLATQQ
jgi:hypothetical protein